MKDLQHGNSQSTRTRSRRDSVHHFHGLVLAAFDLAANPVAARKDAISRHAVRRIGKPEDIANTALWLASNQSSFASGQIFTIDGDLVAASPLQRSLF